MTLPVESIVNSYTGDGSTTVFAYTFTAFKPPDVQVYLDGLLQTSGYQVALDLQRVSFDTAPADGVRVDLWRWLPLAQDTDYQAYDPFPAETHEAALDYLTALIQQLDARQSASLSYDPRLLNPVWDAMNLRIIRVADPLTDEDAINRGWAIENLGGEGGIAGPQGEVGPPGFGRVAQTYDEVRAWKNPFNGELFQMARGPLEGVFEFDENAPASDDNGSILRPDDGTPGAWVRRYNPGQIFLSWFEPDPTGVGDSTVALQAALDLVGSSSGDTTGDTIICGKGTFNISQVFVDRGNWCLKGASRRGTKFVGTAAGKFMLQHRRDTNKSAGVRFENLRFDGNNIAEGLDLQNMLYGTFMDVEIRECLGNGLRMTDAEDWEFRQLDVRKCGELTAVTAQGTGNAGSRNLSVADVSEFRPNDWVIVSGAGAAGADLETIIQRIDGLTLVLGLPLDTSVTNAPLQRGRTGWQFSDWSDLQDGTTPGTPGSIVCNSMSFVGCNSTRHAYHGLGLYKAQNFKFVNCKFHGQTTADIAAPMPFALVMADRCPSLSFTNGQWVQVRWRALYNRVSGGTVNSHVILQGNQIEELENFFSGSVGAFHLRDGGGIIDGNVLVSDSANYLANGFFCSFGNGFQGAVGQNFYENKPAQVFIINDDRLSRPTFSALSGAQSDGGLVVRDFTPTLFGTLTAGNPVYSRQEGTAVRDGPRVHIAISIALTDVGGMTGSLRIGNLPWQSSSKPNITYSVPISRVNGFTTALTDSFGPRGYVDADSNQLPLRESGGGQDSIAVDVTQISNTFRIDLSGFYVVDEQ